MILFFHQENKILHFADDTTIYSCSLNYEEEHRKSSDDTHIVPNWFRINSMVANPGKFQIIFIDKLTFTKHINNLCNTASKTFENFDKNKERARANKTSF